MSASAHSTPHTNKRGINLDHETMHYLIDDVAIVNDENRDLRREIEELHREIKQLYAQLCEQAGATAENAVLKSKLAKKSRQLSRVQDRLDKAMADVASMADKSLHAVTTVVAALYGATQRPDPVPTPAVYSPAPSRARPTVNHATDAFMHTSLTVLLYLVVVVGQTANWHHLFSLTEAVVGSYADRQTLAMFGACWLVGMLQIHLLHFTVLGIATDLALAPFHVRAAAAVRSVISQITLIMTIVVMTPVLNGQALSTEAQLWWLLWIPVPIVIMATTPMERSELRWLTNRTRGIAMPYLAAVTFAWVLLFISARRAGGSIAAGARAIWPLLRASAAIPGAGLASRVIRACR